MARRTVTALALVGGLTLGLATLIPVAWAGPFDAHRDEWDGISRLVALAEGELGPGRVVVSSRLDLHALTRADALLLIHPERALAADELSAFMRAGGRVVLLDDYGTGDGLLAHFGVRRVPLPDAPAEMLRGNPALAIAEPASGHPAVRDVARVVTNHATGLDHPGLSPVLVVRGRGEPDVLVALAGAVGQGRLLAVGDSSVAMNAMLRYPGNHALAESLVRYATEDDVWGKRSGKLYILTNDFETMGTFGSDSPVTNAAGEAKRAFVDALESLRTEGMPPFMAYLTAVVVGLGVIAWTSVRGGKTHKAATPRFVRGTPVAVQGGVAGHAAALGAPSASRVRAMLEWKSALEEDLATRLGLDRAPAHADLVAMLRAARLLDGEGARALAELLASLAPLEAPGASGAAGGAAGGRGAGGARVKDADVRALAEKARALLANVHAAQHGRVERLP